MPHPRPYGCAECRKVFPTSFLEVVLQMWPVREVIPGCVFRLGGVAVGLLRRKRMRRGFVGMPPCGCGNGGIPHLAVHTGCAYRSREGDGRSRHLRQMSVARSRQCVSIGHAAPLDWLSVDMLVGPRAVPVGDSDP